MKLKFDLMNYEQSLVVFDAIRGVWGLVMESEDTAATATQAEPVAVTQDEVQTEPSYGFPIGDAPAPMPVAVSETTATTVDTSETPKTVSKLDELIAGRALTKSVKVADGPQVKVGDEVYSRDGTLLVIEATVRGTAICIDEAGVLHEMPSGLLVADKASLQPTEGATTAPTVQEAPVVEEAQVVAETPAGDLPDDYLLAELHEAGNRVKKAHSVAKVLSLLGEVAPGTVRLSELAVAKRADLLAKFNAAVAA